MRFSTENGRFAFLSPYLGSLGATYDDHLRLIEKRVLSGRTISVNRTFSLGVTAEALRANIGSKSAISLQRGPVDPKFHVEESPHQLFFFSENYRLNDLSFGTEIWTDLSSVLSQITRLTDRRTDRQNSLR